MSEALRSSTKIVGPIVDSHPGVQRSSSFVRSELDGDVLPFPTASEEFAPNAVSAPRDWGRLIAVVCMEVLFFVWLQWARDIGLFALMGLAQ